MIRFFGVRVRLSPLFLIVILAAYLGHVLDQVAVLFAVVISHEIGHVLAAHRFGIKTESIELLPFGGVAVMRGRLGFDVRQETLIAAAGPLVNLLFVIVALPLRASGVLNDAWTNSFVSINLSIALFNLLPALPLDGGRIARAGLAISRGYHSATKVVTRVSFLISVVLMGIGGISLILGYADLGIFALGLFLLYSAFSLSRQSRYDTLRFLDALRHHQGTSLRPIRSMLVQEDMKLGDVASQFSPGAYHIIYVQSSFYKGSRPITQDEILDAIFESSGWSLPLRALLS
ncbi:M50 family metallopeptidase [Ferroacidibacillus organovorans]|uniref:Peptidase M50 domain-containing protein n=1 Tax=Ferroacidibacillus organovorans TaxID=1765683 RepID=A0A1V4EU96_9BACL|nr:M50 family metallopeptidase [Ferroacidibacillus organovorans]OPG16432.1 hypothetical protein B2M26_06020 [Ferroacidibacillus organovorans]